jgi:hypothetical protein
VWWLRFDELDAGAETYDALVAASPEVDAFCSSTAWILPARAAFTPDAPPLIGAGDHGIAAMMIVPVAGGTPAAVALEASWGLASPFASPDPAALVAELYAALRAAPRRVSALVVTGITAGGAAMRALERGARRAPFPAGPPTQRIAASLDGGVDGFLSRRSPKLRATLRHAARAARASSVRLARQRDFTPGEVTALLDRAVAVERRSWKAIDGGGLTDASMETFYRLMLPRLARAGALRAIFAVDGDRDVAFCFGGVTTRGVYRGLQSSYDDAYAPLSPGALVHLEMITLLCEEGATLYDLGTDMEYKRRWGEPGLETVSCVAIV